MSFNLDRWASTNLQFPQSFATLPCCLSLSFSFSPILLEEIRQEINSIGTGPIARKKKKKKKK